jgi:hypothetical protein
MVLCFASVPGYMLNYLASIARLTFISRRRLYPGWWWFQHTQGCAGFTTPKRVLVSPHPLTRSKLFMLVGLVDIWLEHTTACVEVGSVSKLWEVWLVCIWLGWVLSWETRWVAVDMLLCFKIGKRCLPGYVAGIRACLLTSLLLRCHEVPFNVILIHQVV